MTLDSRRQLQRPRQTLVTPSSEIVVRPTPPQSRPRSRPGIFALALAVMVGLMLTTSETRASSQYYLVVVNNTDSKIYFSDYTQWRRPGDLINTWNDVNSVYNNEFLGNDPDYLAPGEVSNQCGEFPFRGILTEDCEAWYLDTFSRYDGHLPVGYDPWADGNSMNDIDSQRWELPSPFYIRSLLGGADFQWRIQYGCNSGSNNEDNWPSSPTLKLGDATFHSEFHDQDWPFADYWEPYTLAVAIINDCSGDVSWGYDYWDILAADSQHSNGYWTEWLNTNDGETDLVGDSEPLGCSQPLDAQCRLITGEKYLDRQPVLSTDTYTCDALTGFSCTHAQQADHHCGDWEVRYYCSNSDYPYGTWFFDLDQSGTYEQAVDRTSGPFGQSLGDQAVVGDFDRDGSVDDVAIYRNADGMWYFDHDHTGTWDTVRGPFGQSPGDQAVAGDFDRDGSVDDVAIFRNSDGMWYFDHDHNGNWDTSSGPFGLSAGDQAVAGDFDRDGFIDDVAIFRNSNGMWYFDHDHDGNWDTSSGPFGLSAGDQPVVGDFDEDGFVDDVAIFRDGGTWYFDYDHTGTWNTTQGPFGQSEADQPVVGDFDRNGLLSITAIFRGLVDG